MLKHRYQLWIVEEDGNENFFVALMTEQEKDALEHHLQKHKGQAISDFVIVQSKDMNALELREELVEWFEVQGHDYNKTYADAADDEEAAV